MRVIVCENYKEVSKRAAEIVADQLNSKPYSVLGLATGSTPIGMYENLVSMNKSGKIDFSSVKSFNLDEYYPIKRDNDQSYHYFMNEHLFSKVNIKPENTHVPNGETDDPQKECDLYEELIERSGGIDLQVLGIGQNGHIGFNEPGTNLCAKTHLTDLTDSTIEANSRFFEKKEDVPTQAITMGISSILKAKKIILLASGSNKKQVVEELMSDSITTNNPATLLKVHPDVILICDKSACSYYDLGVDIGGTAIKFGVVDGNNVVHKYKVDTNKDSSEALINQIVKEYEKITKEYPISKIGVGVPGRIINSLVSSSNLPFDNTNLKQELSLKTGMPVKVENDANCAALGEALAGAGKEYKNIIMITLGTGVGGGIIIKNKIYHGRGDAGEIGHFAVNYDDDKTPCPCGLTGCFEQYASVTALVKLAEKYANDNKDSLLYKLYKENSKLDGMLIMSAYDGGCRIADEVLNEYVKRLSVGILSLRNIFSPDVIVLSGGITSRGDVLLQKLSNVASLDIPVKISSLKSDAGIYGAALM